MPTVRDPDGLGALLPQPFPVRRTAGDCAGAAAIPGAPGTAAHRQGADPVAAARAVLDAEPGLEIDYVEVAEFGAPTLVAAIRVGATRLIDNVRLDG